MYQVIYLRVTQREIKQTYDTQKGEHCKLATAHNMHDWGKLLARLGLRVW